MLLVDKTVGAILALIGGTTGLITFISTFSNLVSLWRMPPVMFGPLILLIVVPQALILTAGIIGIIAGLEY